MIRKFLTFLLFVAITPSLFGQVTSYQNLIKVALSDPDIIFVRVNPLTYTRLEKKELKNYQLNYQNSHNGESLDTVMLLEIIEKAKKLDLSKWTPDELSKHLPIFYWGQKISSKYAIQALGITDATKIAWLKKELVKYNAPLDYNKIYYFSRPVFDKSKKFAVIEWRVRFGQGGTDLYTLVDNNWKKVCALATWIE